MYIAEQNMVGAALGLSLRGKIPFVSTFAAFLTRAFDQIRMSQYSERQHQVLRLPRRRLHRRGRPVADGPGGHRHVPDDPGQRGALSLRRGVHGTAGGGRQNTGASSISAPPAWTRPSSTAPRRNFRIGGCKVLRQSDNDLATVIAAGVTLYEALAAYEELQQAGIIIRVIDLYSVKPVDAATVLAAARATKGLITVEDHYPEGGMARRSWRPGPQPGAPLFPGGEQKAQKRQAGGTSGL